jgi:hypothetical protein
LELDIFIILFLLNQKSLFLFQLLLNIVDLQLDLGELFPFLLLLDILHRQWLNLFLRYFLSLPATGGKGCAVLRGVS